jgi:hypothetical protein
MVSCALSADIDPNTVLLGEINEKSNVGSRSAAAVLAASAARAQIVNAPSDEMAMDLFCPVTAHKSPDDPHPAVAASIKGHACTGASNGSK